MLGVLDLQRIDAVVVQGLKVPATGKVDATGNVRDARRHLDRCHVDAALLIVYLQIAATIDSGQQARRYTPRAAAIKISALDGPRVRCQNRHRRNR